MVRDSSEGRKRSYQVFSFQSHTSVSITALALLDSQIVIVMIAPAQNKNRTLVGTCQANAVIIKLFGSVTHDCV